MSAAAEPDRADVQRLIVYAYAQDRSRHFILRVTDPEQAREFIAALAQNGWITDASADPRRMAALEKKGTCAANVGFTYRGLKRLGLQDGYLRVFQEKAPAFAEGAHPRAARRLADTGRNAAQWWDERFMPENAHVLLSLHANTAQALQDFSEQLMKLPGAKKGLAGWTERPPFEGCHLTGNPKFRTVHFGFRDLIADPEIEGFHEKTTWQDGSRERKLHAPGEFLLGYQNDDCYNPWLLIDATARPNPWLLPLNRAPELAEFFRNGSFGAFRKMQQHERAFRSFAAEWADKLGASKDYVRAKLCGRWDNGRVVKRGEWTEPTTPEPDDPRVLDEFDFAGDPRGEGCPFGSHVRRMNPRGEGMVMPARSRTLLRRGMPYGPAWVEGEPGEEPNRGLLGLFFCASLEDQFEHLLSEWADQNPMGPPNRGRAKDPVMGNHEDPGAALDIPETGEPRRQMTGFTPFVTTRGTLYAFYPSLTALARIAHFGKPVAAA